MLTWSRDYNGLEYSFRQCKGKDCGIYTWLHDDLCAMCKINNVEIVENKSNNEQVLLSTMMDDCCLDN